MYTYSLGNAIMAPGLSWPGAVLPERASGVSTRDFLLFYKGGWNI
jgi:hypothetical protein